MNETIKTVIPSSISQQAQSPQQSRVEISPYAQAELTVLNIRYHDLQETMSRLISILVAENAELKTENAALKNQLTALQTQTITEVSANP